MVLNEEKSVLRSEEDCYNCQKSCHAGNSIEIAGHIYHRQCFRCDFCQISVIDKFYVNERDYGTIILCEKDYMEHFQYTCNQCKNEIVDDEYEIIGQFKYHPACLRCPGCQISSITTTATMEERERFEYNGKPYCRFHYSMIKGTECSGCGQAILYEYRLKNDIRWHPECYMLKKYWQVELISILGYENNYKSKCQLISTQEEFQLIREKLWKETSQFEDFTSRTISNIILQSEKQYESCLHLLQQTCILFTLIDFLFTYSPTNLSCEQLVFVFTKNISLFIEMLNQSDNYVLKIAEKLSTNFKDLLKLSLQQVLVLTDKFGPDRNLIQELLTLLSSKQQQRNPFYELSFLNDHFQLIHSTISKRFNLQDPSHIINHYPNMDEQTDETLIYKASKNTTATLLSASHPDTIMSTIARSKSTTSKYGTEESKTYYDSLKRALTTNRKKQYHRQKFYSVQQDTSPLHISLPNVEQSFSTTPPLSPPTSIQQHLSIPPYLPELSQQQQDHIIRHLSLLYLSHVDETTMEDILDYKKSSTSLWGKLKTHIRTTDSSPSPTTHSSSLSIHENNKKIIGVSLANLSNGSLLSSQQPTSKAYEHWSQTCPYVKSCFSPNALLPSFLRDCILAIIEQDVYTEGLFRKNGNIRGIKEICETINASSPEQESWIDYFREQPILQSTAFVKKFLRELPEPLLTPKLYKLFIACNKATAPVEAIHYTMCLLPKPNRDVLCVLLSLFHWVARHASHNKMDYDNLARVVAPTLLYAGHSEDPKSSTYTPQDIANCHAEISIVSYMIEHVETLIKVPAKFTELTGNSAFLNHLEQNSIDLSSTKQFIRNYPHLLKVKKESSSHVILPPSPSTSSKYHYPTSSS